MSEITDVTLDPALASMLDLSPADDKGYLRCSACHAVITQASARTEVGGRHDHQLVNPHGFEFHVGCFTEALGCDLSGEPQAADSWFMGYEWSIASCAECGLHMGWLFTRAIGKPTDAEYFYGLILDRLVSNTSADS